MSSFDDFEDDLEDLRGESDAEDYSASGYNCHGSDEDEDED